MKFFEYINFPGGSKSKVNEAGEKVRNGSFTNADIQIIEEWRAAHSKVLNTFQETLRRRTRFSKAMVAQRHKRRNTIFGKLERFPRMQLARMDDVAGCRIIFPTIEELYQFRSELHRARFKHKRRNDIDKYDYIKRPKNTGYRGIHDVYSYDVNSEAGKNLKGLLVEIQYRTNIQHAWATAVEVIGFITESQPKFQEGDMRYQEAMALASEILARSYENCKGPHEDICNSTLVERFLKVDSELGLLKTLKGLNAADASISEKKNTILIFSEGGDLEIKSYKGATEALRALFQIEKDRPGSDVVLVKADSSEEVRFAFKNYFSDAKEFITLVERGCEKLCQKSVIDQKEILRTLGKDV
jgi:ppGpp synthetase/RelA/SpoT-type nucleotidyltranferase